MLILLNFGPKKLIIPTPWHSEEYSPMMRPAFDVNESPCCCDGLDVTHLAVITTAYLIFWGPLFAVTLINWDWDYEDAKASTAHEVF